MPTKCSFIKEYRAGYSCGQVALVTAAKAGNQFLSSSIVLRGIAVFTFEPFEPHLVDHPNRH